MINVSVVYASTTAQEIIELEVLHTATVGDAINQSFILQKYPEIGLLEGRVGIFEQRVSLNLCLTEGDRIVIYCPLLHDPKDLRRLRHQKAS